MAPAPKSSTCSTTTPPGHRQPRPTHHHRPRCHRHLHRRFNPLRRPVLSTDRQRSHLHRHTDAAAAPRCRSSWENAASVTSTVAPTTRRPAAKSSASTRPGKNTCVPNRQQPLSLNCNTKLDDFLSYHNTVRCRVRPHRAISRRTPLKPSLPDPKPFHHLKGRAALPSTSRPHRRHRRHHHPLQQPPTPHRIKQTPGRYPRHRLDRLPRHPRP
jgi:hypothetical protein